MQPEPFADHASAEGIVAPVAQALFPLHGGFERELELATGESSVSEGERGLSDQRRGALAPHSRQLRE